MLLVTLTVSYVVSVLDAVTQKRAFASNVSGPDQRGDGIVRTAWDGEGFRGFDLALNSFADGITELTTNHQACPVLHHFYARSEPRVHRGPRGTWRGAGEFRAGR